MEQVLSGRSSAQAEEAIAPEVLIVYVKIAAASLSDTRYNQKMLDFVCQQSMKVPNLFSDAPEDTSL